MLLALLAVAAVFTPVAGAPYESDFVPATFRAPTNWPLITRAVHRPETLGPGVTYDAVGGRFAVGGDDGRALAFSGSAVVTVTAPSAAPTVPATTAPAASAAPTASAGPPAGASAPVAVAPSALPPAVRLGTSGMYHLALGENRQPTLVAGSGQRLWFIDQAKRLATIDTATGAVTDVAQLPLDATVTRLLVGASHVYVIDQGKGRISTVTIKSANLETIAFPVARSAKSFEIGVDDRHWRAGGESTNVLSLDLGTKAVTAISFPTSAITALYVDSAASVWYADDATGGIGYYDQAKRAIVSATVPAHASVTALGMDREGTLWAGTASGQLLAVRLGVGAVGVPAGAVFDTMELQNEPSFEARGFMQTVKHHNGAYKMASWPVRVDGKTVRLKGSPALGQDTAEVLEHWLGIGAAQLETVRGEGVL